MSGISFVRSGTRANQAYSTSASISWNAATAPTPGDHLILAVSYNNCASNTVPTLAVQDNQTGAFANTWLPLVSQGNGSMGSGFSATIAALYLCKNVQYSGSGNFTFTVTSTGGSTRQSFSCNHVEIAGNINVDQIGVYTSGSSLVLAATATAAGQNATGTDFVIACLATSTNSAGAAGSDPPASGYTTLGAYSWSDNAGLTQSGYGEAAYKLLSAGSPETSQATWSGWGNDGFTCAVIATLAPQLSGAQRLLLLGVG